MDNWSTAHRLFALETSWDGVVWWTMWFHHRYFFKNGETVIATQRAFPIHFQLGRRTRVPSRNTILRWVDSLCTTGSTLKKKPPWRPKTAHMPVNEEAIRQSVLRSPQRSARKQAVVLRFSNTEFLELFFKMRTTFLSQNSSADHLSLVPFESKFINFVAYFKTSILRPTVYHGRLARWIKWRACDVGEAKEGLENELWRRWSNRRMSCDVGKVTEELENELWHR